MFLFMEEAIERILPNGSCLEMLHKLKLKEITLFRLIKGCFLLHTLKAIPLKMKQISNTGSNHILTVGLTQSGIKTSQVHLERWSLSSALWSQSCCSAYSVVYAIALSRVQAIESIKLEYTNLDNRVQMSAISITIWKLRRTVLTTKISKLVR